MASKLVEGGDCDNGNEEGGSVSSNTSANKVVTNFGPIKSRGIKNMKQHQDLKTIDVDEVLEHRTTYSFKKWITGYHIYQNIWTPKIGEILTSKVDPTNPFDSYAVNIILDGKLVGHVPRTISETITKVLLADGTLELTVYANPKRTRRNGIIVPCTYILEGPQLTIEHAIDSIYNTK